MLQKKALTIAGSDSSAGAGIQADIKTISALGVYCCTVITALTAQNTQQVTRIFPIPKEIIDAQIGSILTDVPPDAIKLGMLYNKNIINCISKRLSKLNVPIVVDPILQAGTGARLLLENSVQDFIKKIVPLGFIVTPNIYEAQELSGKEIKSQDDMIDAAKKIKKFGAKNVIIKGGHLSKSASAIDILVNSNNETLLLKNKKLKIRETHGSGCNFSSAITAFMAKGFSLENSCVMANEFVFRSIENNAMVGQGLLVTNPLTWLYDEASRYDVMTKLRIAVREVENLEWMGKYIPETATNFVYATPWAFSFNDVAGVKGRIVKIGERARASSDIEFGASTHVASAVLAAMEYDKRTRSGINIKYHDRFIENLKIRYRVAHYDRRKEPSNLKNREGNTIRWGIKTALESKPGAEIVYHLGDIGKEAMIIIFGKNPSDVIEKIKTLER